VVIDLLLLFDTAFIDRTRESLAALSHSAPTAAYHYFIKRAPLVHQSKDVSPVESVQSIAERKQWHKSQQTSIFLEADGCFNKTALRRYKG
jgi:hypothetical protein